MRSSIKSTKDIYTMQEGGKRLAQVRDSLMDSVKVGKSALEIETLADTLIKKSGGAASFRMVPGYSWATCINVNDGVVHGIPHKEIIFKQGDVVSVDVGMYFKGFHTDTSASKLLGNDKGIEKFLAVGQLALKRGIEQAKVENTIGDISSVIEEVIVQAGYFPVKELTGHGIGKNLHEEPFIPCFVGKKSDMGIKILENMTLAIEVMYKMSEGSLVTDKDGWTIRTKDGKLSALFEETVAVLKDGPVVLTQG